MKLVISKSELLAGLARIQAIVEKRNSMPILGNALLQAVTDGPRQTLEISGYDLEVGIRGVHPAQVKSPGKVTVSAKKFFEVVRELPDEPLHLTVTPNNYLELLSARTRFTLAGTGADEYPTIPMETDQPRVRVQAALLSTMIERTMFAASTDESRYNLNGVYFEATPDSGKIRMVATDGHRLAFIDRVIGDEAAHLRSGVIIPRKGLGELKRLVDEDDADEIDISFVDNLAFVRKGEVTLVIRLIEGEFPNYRQVLPKPPRNQLTLSQELFGRALRRVGLISSERSRAAKLQLTEGKMTLSSSNPELGEVLEEIDVDYAGPEISLGFNVRYLLETIGAFHAKEIQLGLDDEISPAQLRPADDPDTLVVVMPMRL